MGGAPPGGARPARPRGGRGADATAAHLLRHGSGGRALAPGAGVLPVPVPAPPGGVLLPLGGRALPRRGRLRLPVPVPVPVPVLGRRRGAVPGLGRGPPPGRGGLLPLRARPLLPGLPRLPPLVLARRGLGLGGGALPGRRLGLGSALRVPPPGAVPGAVAGPLAVLPLGGGALPRRRGLPPVPRGALLGPLLRPAGAVPRLAGAVPALLPLGGGALPGRRLPLPVPVLPGPAALPVRRGLPAPRLLGGAGAGGLGLVRRGVAGAPSVPRGPVGAALPRGAALPLGALPLGRRALPRRPLPLAGGGPGAGLGAVPAPARPLGAGALPPGPLPLLLPPLRLLEPHQQLR